MNSTFSTKDLTLAVTLETKGLSILQLDYTNPQRINFIFERTERLESLVNDYFAHSLRVEPQEFAMRIKGIKTRIATNLNSSHSII